MDKNGGFQILARLGKKKKILIFAMPDEYTQSFPLCLLPLQKSQQKLRN